MPEPKDQENRDFENKGEKSPAEKLPPLPDPRFTISPVSFVDSEYAIGTEIGPYQILSILGEGGCGIVYLGQQTSPIKRRVALKVIKPGMDSKQVIARFEGERQALALLDHPNIARVFDAGATDAGRPYFAMEHVKGIPITEYCDRSKLSTQDRLRLFILLCQAVQHAHQKGIIHRDIKPSNVLVMLQNEEPIPKIIDFGIAKALNQSLSERTLVTEQGKFIGTPEYMSPEQAELTGHDVDTRTDIYSLGVLLYELLTGCTPFDPEVLRGKGYTEMQRIIREQDPIKPSTRLTTLGGKLEDIVKCRSSTAEQLRKSVRDDLDWIVMKSLEKDRARRYSTAQALAEEIERHIKHEPVMARPPTIGYKVQKFVRRNKLMVGAVAAVATVLVIGILVSSWQATRAKKAGQTAREETRIAETERQRAEEGERYAERLLYVANMNLVQQAWEQNNTGRVRQLLDETASFPDRGFEWYYWQRQTHLELKTLSGHISAICSIAISPDSRLIASGSDDQTAKVWDASSGKELLTLKGHSSWVWSVAFSPDSQRIVTGSVDQTAKVWDTATGKELLTLKGHTAPIRSAAYSPDGQRIVTGSWDQMAKVWEATTGKELLTLKGLSGEILSIAFSPNGRWIVSGSSGQTAKVWDAESGEESLTLKGHSNEVVSVAFSPDSQRIITGSNDNTAKVWAASSGRELFTLNGHTNEVRSVAFSPNGQQIVSGGGDQTIRVWEAASGRALFTLKGHIAGIRSVTFTPDSKRIISGSTDRTVKIWEAVGDKERFIFKGNIAGIRSAAISPDGIRIVTGNVDQTSTVWDVASGKELLTLTGHSGVIGAVAFSPDNKRIVSGSWDQTAKVWDATSGKEYLTVRGHISWIWSVAFSPDGQLIATGSSDRTVKVWDVASGKERFTLKGHNAAIRSVAFSPDGQQIVTSSDDHTAKVWEAVSGKELLTYKGHIAPIRSVAFSPDGQRIVTGSEDQTAKIWEVSTGKELFVLSGHNDVIHFVAFFQDGRRIITSSWDATTKVWDATTGKELLTIKEESGGATSVFISPDDQRIFIMGQTAKVSEAATAQQVDAWQREEKVTSERVALLQREQAASAEYDRALRAQDPGAIKQWLILAPIVNKSQTGKEALHQEQIPQEGQIRPRAADRVKLGDTELVWNSVQLDDYLIDFSKILGGVNHWRIAYAVCYIQSDMDQTGILAKVGSDDQAKMYLNGKEIYQYNRVRTWAPDQDVVTGLELKAGLNVLVFKIVNESGYWQGSVRLTDADGNPLKGIHVLPPDMNGIN